MSPHKLKSLCPLLTQRSHCRTQLGHLDPKLADFMVLATEQAHAGSALGALASVGRHL
jgi:hypothetical protein